MRPGLKLDDAIEDELEQLIWRTEELGIGRRNGEMGRARRRPGACSTDTGPTGSASPASIDGAGLRIVLDCANGSGGDGRAGVLAATGATVEVIHNEPDGVNINVESGATAPASLAARGRRPRRGHRVRARRRRRPAASRSTRPGRVVDGDQVLGVLALDRLERGVLPEGALVVSVL